MATSADKYLTQEQFEEQFLELIEWIDTTRNRVYIVNSSGTPTHALIPYEEALELGICNAESPQADPS